MTDLRAAAHQALEAWDGGDVKWFANGYQVMDALRTALEQPEQEPVAWLESPYGSIRMNTTMRFQFPPQSLKWKMPLYTHPPRREWQGLDKDETMNLMNDTAKNYWADEAHIQRFARAIEQALKEKNHD